MSKKSVKKVTKKLSASTLRKKVRELEEKIKFNDEMHSHLFEKVNAALDIYYREDLEVTLKKIIELKEEAARGKERRAYSDTVHDVAERAEEKHYLAENHRLWFLLRSLIGDKTLEKELEASGREVIHGDYRSEHHLGYEPPFKKPRF